MLNNTDNGDQGSKRSLARLDADILSAVKSKQRAYFVQNECRWLIDYFRQKNVADRLTGYGIQLHITDGPLSVAIKSNDGLEFGPPHTCIADCRSELVTIFSQTPKNINTSLRIIAQLIELERSFQVSLLPEQGEKPNQENDPDFEAERLEAGLKRFVDRASTWIKQENISEYNLARIFRSVLLDFKFPLVDVPIRSFKDLENALIRTRANSPYQQIVPDIQSHLFLVKAIFKTSNGDDSGGS